jgi:ubiquinone/menaquinone biosynthesis C-methylase UbiE
MSTEKLDEFLGLSSRYALRVLSQENVDMMAQYLPLDSFKAIYVVDLCHSLCGVAAKKAAAKGWKNVRVVEADACEFKPPEGTATLVTFSYSLSSTCP